MPREILFLFNHDAPHQVAHTATIARALVELKPSQRVTCATGTPAIRFHLESILGAETARAIDWLNIALPPALEAVLEPVNRLAPIKRLLRLDHHAARLRQASLLVSTERTCLRLKSRGDACETRFVHVPHGAGDRAVTYHPGKAGFDAFLVPGDKAKRELIRHGVAREEQVRVVGYAKFDAVDPVRRARLFANDNPVFVYNPHFDPHLSSWYESGPALLDWFAGPAGRGCNLIFAPHIMLFRKKLHISPEYRVAKLCPGIREEWRRAENILIDVDSVKLTDMTYTLAADAYIGDVSSQVYEFMINPRPIFFLDRLSPEARAREGAYPAWQVGEVARSIAQLEGVLGNLAGFDPSRLARQRELLRDSFSYDPARPASQRAAEALLDLLPPG